MKVSSIYRYPVKGLSAERLEKAELVAGETLKYDRAYAIENGPGRFDPNNPKHLPKINFLMLMRNEKLASLETTFEDDEEILTIFRDGKQVAKGSLSTRLGRQMIEQFISAYMANDLKGPPKIVLAQGHSFSDVAAKCVHIVNLNTVKELEKRFGCNIDPLRFRANIYVEDMPAWGEFELIDREIKIADARLKVFDRTQRCEATNVDPGTGKRDLKIPASLLRSYGHSDVGIYASITEAGVISEGDAFEIG